MSHLIKRGVEELRLPKFSLGSEMTETNLENYRSVMVAPGGRLPRLVSKLQGRQAVRPYFDPEKDTDVPYGFVGCVVFGNRMISALRGSEDTPIIHSPSFRRGEVLEVMADPSFVVRSVRLTRQQITEEGCYSYWDEVQFMSDDGMMTRTSVLPEPTTSLDPVVLDRISGAVKLAERKPFIQ